MADFQLSVREIQQEDIKLIADYWLESDPDYLIGMGVDLDKLPSRAAFTNMLIEQINATPENKVTYALIWSINNEPIGHSNVNKITFGKEAFMHLHLWTTKHRQQGMGTAFVKLSLPYYFNTLQLENLFCEPFANNPAPSKTLKKVGFEFEKKYSTIPGTLNNEQEVNRWKLSKENYLKITSGNLGVYSF